MVSKTEATLLLLHDDAMNMQITNLQHLATHDVGW